MVFGFNNKSCLNIVNKAINSSESFLQYLDLDNSFVKRILSRSFFLYINLESVHCIINQDLY